jgi:hypothetical protein
VRSNPARELGGRFLREKKEEGRKKWIVLLWRWGGLQSGIVSVWWGDWSYGSIDRIPPGNWVAAFSYKNSTVPICAGRRFEYFPGFDPHRAHEGEALVWDPRESRLRAAHPGEQFRFICEMKKARGRSLGHLLGHLLGQLLGHLLVLF